MKQTKRFLACLISLLLVFSVIPGNLLQVDAAKKKTVKVKTVKLNKKSVTLVEGDKITLKATLKPKNTTQKKLVWSTSNKKVATVTTKGVVNAKKKGNTTITVKVKGTSKKATCKVTVKALVKVKKVALNKTSVSLQEGASTTLKVTLTPKNTTQKTLQWSTSNKKVATVSSKGVVKAVNKGTATITIKVKGTTKKATCKVTVKAKTPAKIKVTKLTFGEKQKTLEEGSTYQTRITVAPSNATNKSVAYISSNASVATVDANGKVVAKKVGNATITATAKDGSGKTATCKITVKAKPAVEVTKLSFAENEKKLSQGDTYQTKLNIEPSNATNKAVTYTSSNASVATVDANGKVTAKAVGDAAITATAKDGSGKKATMNLHVEFAEVRYILTYNKNFDMYAKVIGDSRRGDEPFEVYRGYSYYCYNKNISVDYKEEIVGDKAQQTIRVREAIPGKVFFYIGILGGETPDNFFKKAEAQVEVWRGNKKVATCNAPSGSEDEWLISAYAPTTGEFTEYNQVGQYGMTTEVYYGDLTITGLKDSRYIDKVNIYIGNIEINTSEKDFYENEQKYMNEIVPIYSNPGCTYEVCAADGDGLRLILENENGKKRTWYIYVGMTPYAELEITKCYAKDGSITYSNIGFYWVELYGIGKELDKDQVVVECKNPNATWEITDVRNEELEVVYQQLVVTHPDGTERQYAISYECDYDVVYPELEIVDINTEDNDVVRFDSEHHIIDIYLNKNMSLSELMDKLQFTLKGQDVRWEWVLLGEVEGSTTIRFTDSHGNVASYGFHYDIDYNAMYGDLRVSDIRSTDSRFLHYQSDDTRINIYGTADEFDDIKDKLQIECAQKGTTFIIREKNEEEYFPYELILTGSNGQERSYDVCYYQDVDAKYGSLEVLDITDSGSILTDVLLDGEKIYLDGAEWSMETFLDKITVTLGEAGATYKFVCDGKDEAREYWILTLTGANGVRREYQVIYMLDFEAYYGTLRVKEIVCEDGKLTQYSIGDSDIDLHGKADSFEEIKDSLKVKLADETADYRFTCETDEELESRCFLVLTDATGKTRSYNINYYKDYGELYVEDITSNDGRLTDYYVNDDSNYINLQGAADSFEEIKDSLSVEIGDENARYEFTSETDEESGYVNWKLILTDADDNTRVYNIYYEVDYEEINKAFEIASIAGGDIAITKWNYNVTSIDISGLVDTDTNSVAEKLTVTMKNPAQTAKIEYLEDEEDWYLIITGANDLRREYRLTYWFDYDAYYGNLKVTSVECSDESFLDYEIYDNSISISGTKPAFDDIKPLLTLVLADKTASANFVQDEDCWNLILKGAEGKERIYSIRYSFEDTTDYGNLYVEDVTSRDEKITQCNVDNADNYIYVNGIVDEFGDIKDSLNIVLADESASYEFASEVDEDYGRKYWKLILTGADNKERIYTINYYVDYDERAEFCAIEDINSDDVTLNKWEYDGDWLYLYGKEKIDLDDIVEKLTVTLKNSELTTNIMYSEDNYSWNLVISGSDGFEVSYIIDYILE